MTLIVESGVGITGANSYCSGGLASLYIDALGAFGEWETLINAGAEEGVLIAATRAIESRYCWLGTPLTTTQGLGLPRATLTLEDGRTLAPVAQIALAAEACSRLALTLWRERPAVDGTFVTSETLGAWSARFERVAPAGFEAIDSILAPMWSPSVPAGWVAA